MQTLSPQFLLSQKLLQLTSLELRAEITAELNENPALELEEIPTCQFCSAPMAGSRCSNCGKKRTAEDDDETDEFIQRQMNDYDGDAAAYEAPYSESGDRPSFLDFYHEEGGFHDMLMNNFYASSYPADLRPLGECLIQAITEDGFLNIDMDTFVEDFSGREFEVTDEQVRDMIAVIQTLDPPGIGAPNARAALLIQLDMLEAEGSPSNALAKRIISDHFEDLGKNKLQKVSAETGASMADISRALDYIRRNLTPYPGRALIRKTPEAVFIPKPSIEIKYDGKELSYDILEMNDFKLKINSYYLDTYRNSKESGVTGAEMQHVREYFKRAKFFMDSVGSRRTTLEKIAGALIEEQTDFLIHGLPHFNGEVTQTSLAEKIGLHESTVSRAMSKKYVLIPSGDVLSFDFFFDASVRPKEYIRNFILKEDPDRPLADADLQKMLADKGIEMARRTVAKYREEMHVPSSYDRKRNKAG